MTKRGVFFVDVFVSHAFGLEVRAQDFVGGAGVHIVGAQQDPALGCAAFFAHQVVDCRNGLLVGRSTGVEHVFRQLFTFVLHGVKQQAVHFFHHRQHRLARHRSPAAEDHRDLVLTEQLLGFFSKQRPVGSGVNNHRLKLFAEHTALGVDLVDGHEHGVFQHGFRNGHGARQAVQHAHLDGVSGQCLDRESQTARHQGCGSCEGFEIATTVHHEITPIRKVGFQTRGDLQR